jgi:ribosomal protein S18 acetylase RimI-like enzyme
MEELVISVRPAWPEDATSIARVYIASWHDTYAGVLPTQHLCAMTSKAQTARWQSAIRTMSGELVLVAESETHGIVGMTSFGIARDRAAGYDGEVYTLYVDPNYFGRGVGRQLLRAGFGELRQRGFTSCIIWAHAQNPARFFYEAMGGRLVAERTECMMGGAVPETGFGWHTLALAERAAS